MRQKVQDLIIVGGGPVGLYGIYLAGLYRMRVTLIERLQRIGGQPEFLYPDKPIYDIGAIPQISGRDLIVQLRQQALQYPAEICTGETALELKQEGRDWKIRTDRDEHAARAVILTTGIGEFVPRKLNIPAVDRFIGHGVFYVVESLRAMAGRRVLVVGGGDSAADWAMAVSPLAERVVMIHRRNEFQCHPDSLDKLQRMNNVEMVVERELIACQGEDSVRGMTVRSTVTGEEYAWDLDRVIVAIGLIPTPGPVARWGLAMDHSEIVVDSHMATNLPGVFAAGDGVTYPGKVKLISAGFGEVATAVQSARRAQRESRDS